VIVGYIMWKNKCTKTEAIVFLRNIKRDVFIGGYNYEKFFDSWYEKLISIE
jgi:hypothetical protein